jgi:hypothetical protein
MNLTPDSVKATPEYRAARAAMESAFAKLRAVNAAFQRTYSKEIRAERRNRTKESTP